jgi:hypothetical protein
VPPDLCPLTTEKRTSRPGSAADATAPPGPFPTPTHPPRSRRMCCRPRRPLCPLKVAAGAYRSHSAEQRALLRQAHVCVEQALFLLRPRSNGPGSMFMEKEKPRWHLSPTFAALFVKEKAKTHSDCYPHCPPARSVWVEDRSPSQPPMCPVPPVVDLALSTIHAWCAPFVVAKGSLAHQRRSTGPTSRQQQKGRKGTENGDYKETAGGPGARSAASEESLPAPTRAPRKALARAVPGGLPDLPAEQASARCQPASPSTAGRASGQRLLRVKHRRDGVLPGPTGGSGQRRWPGLHVCLRRPANHVLQGRIAAKPALPPCTGKGH